MMIGKALILVYRHLNKNLVYVLVNGLGLTISFAMLFFLYIYTNSEKDVDNFHDKQRNIYRVVRDGECAFSPPFGQYILDNISGTKSFCRIFVLDVTLKTDFNLIKTKNCYYTDSNFFEIFSFPLIQGKSKEVLASRNNMVISESFARKIFPNTDPIGRKVRLNNRLDYVVTGVFKDFDQRTHFQPADVILPYPAFADWMGSSDFLNQTDQKYFLPALYIQADENVDLSKQGSHLYQLAKTWYWLFQENGSKNTTFQPIKEAYLHPVTYGFQIGARQGNPNQIHLMELAVFIILFLTILNYLNLNLTFSKIRTSEISVKKIFGAENIHIIFQIFLESFLLLIISLSASIILIFLLIPIFENLTSYKIDLDFVYSKLNIDFVLGVLFLSIFFSWVPGIMVSNLFTASEKYKSYQIHKKLQQFFVSFQFSLTFILISSMLILWKQQYFLTTFDPGFKKEELIYIPLNSEIKDHKLAFKDELGKIQSIKSISLCNGMPGEGIFSIRFDSENKSHNLDYINIDDSYFMTMGIKTKPIERFNPNDCWITRTAAKELDYQVKDSFIKINELGVNAVYKVREILPDLNYHSLTDLPKPIIFTKLDVNEWVDYVLMRTQTNDIPNLINQLNSVYQKFSSNFPFEYHFVKNKMNENYEKELKTSYLISWFSFIALVISASGIFTLSVFSLAKRTKELGIRKVNGAKISILLYSLSIDFMKWVLISFIPAIPISLVLMNYWLADFVYKTPIDWWIFLLTGLIVIVFTLFTIIPQIWRAASRNPVESLRYE